MKIEIKGNQNSKFYDEFLFVAGNYKKIKEKPNKKARLLTSDTERIYTFIIVFFVLFILAYFKYKDVLYLFVISALFLLSIFVIGYYNAIKKRIKLYLNTETSQTLNITEKGLELKQKNQDIKINWSSVECIVINKYSICVLPKKPTELLLSLSTDYKKDFIKGLEKYKKEKLIIDNTKD